MNGKDELQIIMCQIC